MHTPWEACRTLLPLRLAPAPQQQLLLRLLLMEAASAAGGVAVAVAVRREVVLYMLQPWRQVVKEDKEREREERQRGRSGGREAKDRVRHVRKVGQGLHLGRGGGIEKKGMCKGCRT